MTQPAVPDDGPRAHLIPLWLAGFLGLVLGVAGTVGVVVVTTDDDPDDVDVACQALDGVDADDVLDGGIESGEIYRLSGAAQLFLAAADGDFDSPLGTLGDALQRGFQLNDADLVTSSIDDAERYCDGR